MLEKLAIIAVLYLIGLIAFAILIGTVCMALRLLH